MRDRADARQIVVRWILGIEARFNRGSVNPERLLCLRHRLAGSRAQLPFHEVDAGNEFGHGVLDLQPRIHFHEIKLLRWIEKKFDCSGADVADGARREYCSLSHGAAHVGSHPGRRRFFDDFLVTPLHGAVTIVQRHHIAV